MQKDCSVIIMAAGNSARMGYPKFALTIPDGSTFLERIIEQYATFGCREIIVVLNKEGELFLDQDLGKAFSDITFVINQHPEFERFYSIKTGLSALKTNHPVFVHNTDNPFANHKVLNALYANKANADLIKPIFKNKGGHPILISNKIVRAIISNENNSTYLNVFLKNFTSKEIETSDEKILVNVNTDSDYKNLEFEGTV